MQVQVVKFILEQYVPGAGATATVAVAGDKAVQEPGTAIAGAGLVK